MQPKACTRSRQDDSSSPTTSLATSSVKGSQTPMSNYDNHISSADRRCRNRQPVIHKAPASRLPVHKTAPHTNMQYLDSVVFLLHGPQHDGILLILLLQLNLQFIDALLQNVGGKTGAISTLAADVWHRASCQYQGREGVWMAPAHYLLHLFHLDEVKKCAVKTNSCH